jgi:hypothetical protein
MKILLQPLDSTKLHNIDLYENESNGHHFRVDDESSSALVTYDSSVVFIC